MSIEALTHDDGGRLVVPDEATWPQWVSASATRQHAIGDPLLDWLNLYGEAQGFVRDEQRAGYDLRTDFTTFIFAQGRAFESAVIELLRADHELVTIAEGPEAIRDLASAQRTFEAMRAGVPIIVQGVLRDAEHRTYGAPDLLVRSDVLARLFPRTLDATAASVAAPDLGGSWHYRVVDIKFTTLHLAADESLANQGGSSPAYKLQLHVYNRALGRIQGFTPPAAYLLGRSWQHRDQRGTGCLERLAPVPQDGTLARGRPIAAALDEAVAWVRAVREDGATWTVLPEPTRPELYPNVTNTQDGPWHAAKQEIAAAIDEVTLLWQVGRPGRAAAHAAGVYRWRDAACTPATVGVRGDRQPGTLQAILDVNRDAGPPVRPAHVRAHREFWDPAPPLEFYVDFETVSDLDDDFTRLPARGGQPLIFMIGCGHLEADEWRFASFVVETLTEPEEARIIEAWLAHMAAVRARLDPGGDDPPTIHWSHAEVGTFETAYNSAQVRHNRPWQGPRWFDFLQQVIREEPVVVRGALGFGLKPVSRALHALGAIETVWGDGPADGMGAMIGAWWCQHEVLAHGGRLLDHQLMRDIVAYNEVDCRVMMEVVRYLRTTH